MIVYQNQLIYIFSDKKGGQYGTLGIGEPFEPFEKEDMSDMFRRAMFEKMNLVGKFFGLFLSIYFSHYQSLFLSISLPPSLSVSEQLKMEDISDMFIRSMFEK